MERGSIPIAELPGGFDLQSTLESGQTFAWARADGRTYETTGVYGGSAWYHTVHNGDLVRVRQRDDVLEWESTTDAVPILTDRFRLTDDLDQILTAIPPDSLLTEAIAAYNGMRVCRDPFFPCLISFICSAQMHVKRIFQMHHALAKAYGTRIQIDGQTFFEFPTADQLSNATEPALRDLGVGYRAPYLVDTATLVATDELTLTDIPEEYEPARDALTRFVGVGEKVADCVCLFALGFLQAVPLDTWIQKAIKRHYPACDHGDYDATSRAIRDRFGPYAGYAQTYIFHYIRHRF